MCAASTSRPASANGSSTPSRKRASSATKPGPRRARPKPAGNMGVWAPMSADTELGLVYVGVELPQTDLLGVSRTGTAPVRRKPGGAGHRDRRAQMALPDDPSRHLGPRRLLRRRDLRHPAQRQDHQGDRPAHQAGLCLCAGPHQRQAGLADPGKEGRQGQRAGRMVFAHPAHPQRAAALRQAGRHRGTTWWTGRRRSRRGPWRSPAIIIWARSTIRRRW